MPRILIIGMNPSNKPTKGKTSATFKKLEKWMDELGIQYFSFCNTYDEQAEAKFSNVDFNRLCTASKGYDKIIALGGFVSASLNKINIDHFKMPHPSPRNRLLNDKSFELDVLNKCRSYLK